ncbi:MAG: transposase [Bacteroidetes bacterium]|nr:transposase [Bacteroidota bacterium]
MVLEQEMISISSIQSADLTLHPHLHCVIPQGGLTKKAINGNTPRARVNTCFRVKAMSKVFRAKYLAIIRKKIRDIDKNILNTAYKKDWVVYAKRPFGNAESVMEYIGRYTHKIAISNRRITNIDENTITFGIQGL